MEFSAQLLAIFAKPTTTVEFLTNQVHNINKWGRRDRATVKYIALRELRLRGVWL